MGYSKEKAVKIEDFKSAYMPAGINENCVLKEAILKESPTGKPILEITFENEENQIVHHTEWEPIWQVWMKSQEDLEDSMNKQYKRMLQILLCYYKDEEIDFNGDNFREFAKYIVDKLENADKTLKVRLKVVYNKDGYTTLPNSVSRKFIEPMSVSKEDSEIKIDPKYDIIVRPIVANKETVVNNPFSPENVTTTQTSENPFKSENVTTTQNVNPSNDLPF